MAKIIYELKRYHHRKAYRKGDLEAEDIQDAFATYATRREANEFLESKAREARRNGWKYELTLVKRGDKASVLWVYTGVKWIHENTGEEEIETYAYEVKKKTI